MAYVWESEGGNWLECDGRFQPDPARADLPPARLDDLLRLRGAGHPQCACAERYPEDFQFCPQCGRALSRPAAPAPRAVLPRHVPAGLPVTAQDLRPLAAKQRADCQLPQPPNALCVFQSGYFGFAEPRLLALAITRNVLQYWDPAARFWQILSPAPDALPLDFKASIHTWLGADAARRGEAGLLPSPRGLLRLWIHPGEDSYRTELLVAGRVAAAPGLLKHSLACLLAGAEGLRLWHSASPQGEPLPRGLPDSGWSRPFAYDEYLGWLNAQGQLCWHPASGASWWPWPEGWQPRLEFGGPVQSRDGRLWLAGHDGSGYSFCELGTATPERRTLDGARLGFARLLFRRGHAVHGDPWELEQVQDAKDEDTLVLPLLAAFHPEAPQAEGLVLRLHQASARAEDLLHSEQPLRASVEWAGRTPHVLDELPRLIQPLSLQTVLHDGALYLHHPLWPALRGWRLEPACAA